VEWGLSGFVPAGLPSAGYDDVASGVGLTGLTSATTYDYYLRTDCAAGGGAAQSSWIGPFSFTTPCLPDIAPYTESFDGPSLDVCASLSAVAGGPWRLGINYTWNSACAAPADHTGNGGSFISNDMSTPDAGVVYQLNDVDVSALTTPYLDMYHYMCGPYNNEVYVEAWDGAAWVQVGLINTSSPNWENYGYDLTGFTFAANLVRIRFRLEEGSTGTGSQFNSDVALDDISIIEAPSCLTPTALAAGLVSTSEVVLSWTSAETVFDLAIGVAPLAAPVAGDSVGVGNNLTVTGLTPNTTYEYYVRADCGAGGGTGQSTWAGPFSFFTGYCLPSSASTATYVDNFTTTGGVANINSVGTGFTAGGYFDGTASVVESFENGTFDFSAEIVGGTVGFSFWIDWNNDLVFDASEKEFNTTGYSNGPFTGTITVPAGTALGNYRMRITADWNASNPNNPCANASRAEFEDYTLSVVAQPACLPPTALSASVTSSDATLSWTSTETVFDVAVGVAPLAAPVAGDSVGVGNNLTVTGLTSNTTYEYYVRADCAAGGGTGQSAWAGPFSFTTLPGCGDNLTGLCYSLTSTQEVLVSFAVSTPGDWATLTFNAGGVETCCDEVIIYDGLNGTGNIIYGSLTGGGLADYSGEGTITSTTGQLSLVINSDVSATCNSTGTYTSFDVTVNCFTPPCFEDTIPVVACDSIMLAGAMQTISGLYTDSLTSVTGCDSIVTFDLTINSSDQTFAGATSCNPADTGVVVSTFTNALGCDSVHTVTTTLLPTSFETVDVADCDSVDVLGIWYFVSTTFNDTIVGGAANGCDSITTFNVTVNLSDATFENLSSCNPADTGVVVSTFTNALGCDSVHTVTTTLLPTSFETVDVTDCDSTEVLGTWYFASTSFNDTIVGGAANGCDSITTFNLTLNSSSVGSVDTTICDDESLTLPDGAVVTAAGTYTSVLVGANGCDSVVTTELSVIMCTTGVEGIEGIETLSIYPNPYISSINLLFDDAVAGELNITLFDVTGRVLKAESVMTAIGANTISINVSPEVASGVHILQIERDGAVYSTTLIKK
jgi:hypothetical protein